MIYIFDESDEQFRFPSEAIEVFGTLRLCIKLRRGKALNPKVFIYPDGRAAKCISMDFDCVVGMYDRYVVTLDFDIAGLYWYHFSIQLAYGGTFTVPEYAGGGFQVTAYTPSPSVPCWLDGGVIYHIFVDRFFRAGKAPIKPGAIERQDWGGTPYFLPDENGIVRNNDFFGGDIPGVIEKLPYLKDLGVNCIYLSPVFEATSNHKYDTADFLKVDTAFGGDEALEQLCAEAGLCGIKVILDGVFNHVGSDSLYFDRYGSHNKPGAYQNPDSPYRNWFYFHEDGTYDSWWGIELLPSVNEHDTSYIDFICGDDGVLAHWMRKGVSGWRLDVVDELPDVFLDPLCQTVKSINPNAYIVGEVWEDASHKIAYGIRRKYFLGGQLDSVTNYPLKNAIIACIKDGNIEQLADTMSALCRNYPKPVLDRLMNILGTHDTMRILTVLGGTDFPEGRLAMSHYKLSDAELELGKRRLRQAAVLQFLLPGIPCVYYGDEVGADGGADPFNRRCFPWGHEDLELLSWYKKLAKLRKSNSCFADGRYNLIEARSGVFAFSRGNGFERALVAVNVSDSDRTLSVHEFDYDLLNDEYTDTLTIKAGGCGIFSIRKDYLNEFTR